MFEFERKDSKIYQRGNWLSQFGLYRYEKESNRIRSRQSIIGIYGLLGMLSILIVVIFLCVSKEINGGITKPIVVLENTNSNQTDNPTAYTTLPTTITEENDIIDKSYETVHIIATSNADNISPESSEVLNDLEMAASDENHHSLSMEYRSPYQMSNMLLPSNHRPNRKQFSVARPFEYILQGTPPTAFHLTPNDTLESHSISFPQIPKDYVGNVKSIQDILQKVNADEGFILPTLEGDKKIRFGGTYRHRKDNSFADIFDRTKKQHYSGTYVLPSASSLKPAMTENPAKKDPFYMYKPQTPSDINLLATHEFRFAPPIRYSTPKPLMSKPGYVPGNILFKPYAKGQEVSSLYQQIIAANLAHNYKMKEESRRSETNQQKPFSLMLDVYPMTDDEPASSTTSRPYLKYRNPYYQSSSFYTPNLSVAAAAAVKNPQLPHHHPSLDTSTYYHHNLKIPQIPKQHLLEAQHYYNQLYLSKLQKTKNSFNPYYHQSASPVITAAESNTPSQITVHLNLFPKNKNRIASKMRNVEILSRNEEPFASGEGDMSSSTNNREGKANVYPRHEIEIITTQKPKENIQLYKSTTTTENPLKKMLKMEMVPSIIIDDQKNATINQLIEIEQTSGLGDHHCDTIKCRNENYQFYDRLHSTTTTKATTPIIESSTLHERTYEIDDDEDDQQLYSETINQYDQGVVATRSPTPIPTIIPIEPRSFTEDDYSS